MSETGHGQHINVETAWTNDSLLLYVQALLEERDRRFEALALMADERDLRYDQRFVAQEQAVRDALDCSEKAVTKAETATEKRFEAMNNFREQLADQARDFMPRKEAESLVNGLTVRMDQAEKKIDVNSGRLLGSTTTLTILISAMVVVISIVALVLSNT